MHDAWKRTEVRFPLPQRIIITTAVNWRPSPEIRGARSSWKRGVSQDIRSSYDLDGLLAFLRFVFAFERKITNVRRDSDEEFDAVKNSSEKIPVSSVHSERNVHTMKTGNRLDGRAYFGKNRELDRCPHSRRLSVMRNSISVPLGVSICPVAFHESFSFSNFTVANVSMLKPATARYTSQTSDQFSQSFIQNIGHLLAV